tara:strand:+ start:2099 stop:2503 length:405 start_codon:yes stop_codon:yes gene_type:complete
MQKRNSLIIVLSIITIINFSFAGCGGCQINNIVEDSKKTSAFIQDVPIGGKIEGFVIASCSKCNLGKNKDKKCSMGIQIGNKVFNVSGDNSDHQSSHDSDGICNALRIAYVSGLITNEMFYADNFVLIENPNSN